MLLEQVSWLSFILLAAPSHPNRTVASLRLSSRAQSRGGGSFELPSLDPEATHEKQAHFFMDLGLGRRLITSSQRSLHKKIPGPNSLRPGDAVFHPRSCLPALPPVRESQRFYSRASRSSGFRFILLAAPSHPHRTVASVQVSSPVTAAGPRRIHTVFPFMASWATRPSGELYIPVVVSQIFFWAAPTARNQGVGPRAEDRAARPTGGPSPLTTKSMPASGLLSGCVFRVSTPTARLAIHPGPCAKSHPRRPSPLRYRTYLFAPAPCVWARPDKRDSSSGRSRMSRTGIVSWTGSSGR